MDTMLAAERSSRLVLSVFLGMLGTHYVDACILWVYLNINLEDHGVERSRTKL
jgi:hypothetical protein